MSEEVTLGPEPELLAKPELLVSAPEEPLPSKAAKTQTRFHVRPHLSAFSCTLLLWVIAFVVFFVAYLALSLNGLWCPDPMNNATLARMGTQIRFANFSVDPCTNIYGYSCDNFIKTHGQTSVLTEMEYRNLLTIDWSITGYQGDTNLNVSDLEAFASLGIYGGVSVEVSPDLHLPSRYALFISPNNRDYAFYEYKLMAITPPCLLPGPLKDLIISHLQHVIYMANESGVCTRADDPLDAQSQYETLRERPEYAQISEFYPNTLSSMFSQDQSSTDLHAFVEGVRGLVVSYIHSLGWLDVLSRSAMIHKIQSVAILVGGGMFPVDDCEQNSTLAECMAQRNTAWLDLVGSSVNPARVWSMAATEANAYYSPQYNHIAIPFGIAGYPVYNPEYDHALNLGGLGVIIAHEFFHSVDLLMGAYFDTSGQQHNWMPATGMQKLTAYMTCIENHYVHEGMRPELSTQSIGEIMADTFGTAAIFASTPRASPNTFLMFAQTFCSTNGYEPRAIASKDFHAAPFFRVNVSLDVLPSFRSAFHCSTSYHPCDSLL